MIRRRVFSIAITLALICALVLPALPVLAGAHDDVPTTPKEQLEKGWKRLNPHTKAHTISTEVIDGVTYATVEAEIDSLPATLDDNRTLIDTNWYLLKDKSGQNYFQNGDNLFTARVLEGRVSVEDKNGRMSVWNPRMSIGNDSFSGGVPIIVDDPINENYKGNCLKWEYGSYGGWWVFGGSAKVERYLRVIEGYITETWILPDDPKTNVVIKLNESVGSEYGANITWLNAYDADGKPLEVNKNRYNNYVINATEFVGKTYPITIDPSQTFTTSSDDAMLQNYDESYSVCRTDDDYVHVYHGNDWLKIGQSWYGPDDNEFVIARSVVMFNTLGLPDDAVIDSSTLKLYAYSKDIRGNDDFYIVIQSGMPTYPRMPPVNRDYYYGYYSGNGGQFHTSGWSTSSYNDITLSSQGKGWINLTGWTKFMLRSSEDIAGNPPASGGPSDSFEELYAYSYEKGVGYQSKLYVTYHIPIEAPTCTTLDATTVTETSALLKGYLDDDGGEPSSVRFRYRLYGGDPQYTAWESGYTSGEYFEKTVYGLTPGTEVNFAAGASNSHSTVAGSTKYFMPYPYLPSNFTATGEEDQIALTWSKGSGADKTTIRRAEGSYPTTPTSGTAIYNDTGTSHDDNTTVNGTTYYYSAWSWSEKEYTSGGEYSQQKATDYGVSYTLDDPTVTTNAATNVELTTATLNLYLNDLGGYESTDVWFQYYKGAGDWEDNETTPTTKTSPGSHSAGVVSLTTDTLYHVRAAAINTHGTSYGSDVPFTTNAPSAPTMTTNNPTGVQLTSVTLHGTVTADGDATVTAWYEYGRTIDLELGSTPTVSGLSTDSTFYYNLGNLSPATTYYYRAVGENSAGKGYGAILEFETATPDAPTLNTDEATEVGSNVATLHGTLTSDGGVPCEVRFQVGTDVGYGTDTGWQPGFTTGMKFNQFITGLTIGETYHFRAQARNAGGTTNGSDKTFLTKFTPPTKFNCKAISSSTISSSWVNAGDQTYVRYKAAGFPIDKEDGIPAYFGPDEECSVSGLQAGTTYYFRAWSWREGDNWAEGYAEDVATTLPTVPGAEEERPQVVLLPDMPGGWFVEPSGAALANFEFYQTFVDLAEDIGMPEGNMWLLMGLILTVIAAGVTFWKTHNTFAAVAVGCLVICTCSIMGMMSLWFVFIYAILGFGYTFIAAKI